MEPTPPCGTTLAVKLKGECVPCRTGTYSHFATSDACKTCTDCGSRDTLISCTTERDAECKECPRFHFEDPTTNTCKHCDFCCERNPSARLKCITSKTCNITCTHTTSIRSRGKFTHRVFRKFSKENNSSGRISGLISQWKEKIRPVRSAQNDDDPVTNSEGENEEHQIQSKSIRSEDRQDIEDAQLSNLESPDTIQQDQTGYFPVAQDKDKMSAANVADQHNATDKRNQLSVSTAITPIRRGKDHQLVGTTLPTQLPIQATLATTSPSLQQSPHLISLPLFLSSSMGTLSVLALLGLVILVIYMVRKCIHKRRGDYKRLQSENSLDQPDNEGEEIRNLNFLFSGFKQISAFYSNGKHAIRGP